MSVEASGVRKFILLVCLFTPVWAEPPAVPVQQIDNLRATRDPFFLDVRSAQEIHALGTLKDYYNIPLEDLERRLDELPRDRPILTA